jgi:glycosyltransferase involved in cell wall biosynthesis
VLHLSHLHAWDIESSPYGAELRRLGVAHRFIATPVNMRYRSLAGLLLRVYPTLIRRTLGTAFASLWRAPPQAMVVSSDIEALIYGTLRTLLRRRTLVVLPTLIVTPRRQKLLNAIYMAYWRRVFAAIDLGICHARAELAGNARLFPGHAEKLAFVPFGTTVTDRDALRAMKPLGDGVPVIVTAGRSGRDYPTLARAIAGLNCKLLILCDVGAALAGVPASPRIEVVRDRFGDAYLETLAGAAFVVVPLAVQGVSAGQMVLLQAAAIGRAVIITRTETTTDYATDEMDALLVERGDEAALRRAIVRLLEDPALCRRLGEAAAARFERDHSTEAYVRGLVGAIDARLADLGRPPL